MPILLNQTYLMVLHRKPGFHGYCTGMQSQELSSISRVAAINHIKIICVHDNYAMCLLFSRQNHPQNKNTSRYIEGNHEVGSE